MFAFETKTIIQEEESMNFKLFGRGAILLVALLLVPALAFGGAKGERKEQKLRFAVGWTSDQAIEHLKPDEYSGAAHEQ